MDYPSRKHFEPFNSLSNKPKSQNLTISADLHTHTRSSGHASGTVEEIAKSAEKKGLKLIAITDHGSAMAGTYEPSYLKNLSAPPIKIGNVIVLRGIEANVISLGASLDVSSRVLANLEWVIASLHEVVIDPVNSKTHTEIYLRLAENPLVDMIGHPDTPFFECDYERVIREFGAKDKIVEINNYHAFHFGPRNREICETIAKLCMKHEVFIAVNSDAHNPHTVGNVEQAIAMLEKMGFPEELILNANVERIIMRVRKKHPRYTVEGN